MESKQTEGLWAWMMALDSGCYMYAGTAMQHSPKHDRVFAGLGQRGGRWCTAGSLESLSRRAMAQLRLNMLVYTLPSCIVWRRLWVTPLDGVQLRSGTRKGEGAVRLGTVTPGKMRSILDSKQRVWERN